MDFDRFRTKYLERLLQGDRMGCRQVLVESLQTGTPANIIYTDLFWEIMSEIDRLYRNHSIDRITEQMATRINRTLVDQLQSKLPRSEPRNLKMVITCAANEPEELGAQMCADLFESDGWEVKFIGGAIPCDEIINMVGEFRPDVLFIYGTKPSDAPGVRSLMDTLRNIQACPKMRIMLSGGVFNRAEGLWEEIGADLFAATAKEALEIALTGNRAEPNKRKNHRPTSRKTTKMEPEVVKN